MEYILSNQLISSLSQLQKAKDNNKLVVFAGSGVSVASDVDTWSVLCNKMKNVIGDTAKDESDPLKIAQLLYNDLGEKRYNDFVRTELKYKKTQYNDLHKLILELKPAHIITTNYDNHFEQYIEKASLSYSIIKKDKDLPYAEYLNLLVKMHGDFDELNMVLKEEDYLNFSENFTLIEGFIKSIFTNYTVLFIGYGFGDFDLKSILQNVRNILGNNTPLAYIFFPSTKSETEKKYLLNKGLSVISPDLISFEEDKNTVPNRENPWTKLNNSDFIPSKTDLTNETINFLKYIQKFNEFEFRQQQKNIFEQIVNSFSRFEELVIIPRTAFTEVFPFRDTESYFSDNIFYIDNQELSDFIAFYTSEKGDNNNTKRLVFGKNVEDVKLPVKYQSTSNVKYIREVIQYLNSLGIFRIVDTTRGNISELYLFDDGIYLGDNSLIRKYYQFKFIDVFEEIQDIIRDNTFRNNFNWKKNLQTAYFASHFGQIEDALTLLRDIAIYAQNSKKHLLYFICKFNQKRLRDWLFLSSFRNTTNRELFLKEIDEIDLDQLCETLPVDRDTRILIRSINKGEDVLALKRNVENAYKILYDKHRNYKNPSFNSWGGKNENRTIFTSVHNLIDYSANNNIYIENYEDYSSIITEALKGLLLSTIIDDRYHHKLKFWHLEYTTLFVHWTDFKEFNNYILDNDIKILVIEEKNRERLSFEFIELFKRLLEIFKTDNKFVDNLYYVESLKIEKIKRAINNFLIFGYLFDLSKDEFLEIKSLILDTLEKVIVEFRLIDSDILIQFLKKYIRYFDDDDFKKLLKTFIQIHIKSEEKYIIKYFSILKKRRNVLWEKEEIEFIISNFQNGSIGLETFFKIYLLFFSEKDQNDNKYLIENILDRLINKIGILRVAQHISLLPVQLSDIHNQEIIDLIMKISSEIETLKHQEINPFYNRKTYKDELYNFTIAFLYLRSIGEDFKSEKYEKLKEFRYAKWLIYPDDFNYEEDFDLLWLEYDLTCEMVEELKLFPKVKNQYERYLKDYQKSPAFNTVLNHYLKHFV